MCVTATGMEDQHGAVGERRGARIWTPATSRGVMQHGFPVSPVRDWIRRSRSFTCRIPAPVTRRITRLRCPLAAAVSEVPGRLTEIWLGRQGVPQVAFRASGRARAEGAGSGHLTGSGHLNCHREPGNWTEVPAD